jgi:hypothetical protein
MNKRQNSVQDEEAISLIAKNDAMTLSFVQFFYMMLDVVKYSNSAYMTFLAIEQHISSLSEEEKGALDYEPYFIFLCTLLVGTVLLILVKYRSSQFENVFRSFLKEDNQVVQIRSVWFRGSVVFVSVLLIGGYIYIAYYHLIYKAYDKTRLLLFFVMGTGVFSFLVSAKECLYAFNSYQQVQQFALGNYKFQVLELEESHLKGLKMSSIGKMQGVVMALFTVGVEFYIGYSMIQHLN